MTPRATAIAGGLSRLKRAIPLVSIACAVSAALVSSPAAAQANTGTARITALPESSMLEGRYNIEYECATEGTCYWFPEASVYPASTECPPSFDPTHGIWVGESQSIKLAFGSSTFAPPASKIRVCLYAHEQNDELVGEAGYPQKATTRPQPHSRTPGCRVDQYGMLLNTYPGISSMKTRGLPAETDRVAPPCLVAESIARAIQATWALRQRFPHVVQPHGDGWHAAMFRCQYTERRGTENPYTVAACRHRHQLVTMDLIS